MSLPSQCPKCGCELVTEVYSVDRSKVAIICGGCLKTLAIAVKAEAMSKGVRE